MPERSLHHRIVAQMQLMEVRPEMWGRTVGEVEMQYMALLELLGWEKSGDVKEVQRVRDDVLTDHFGTYISPISDHIGREDFVKLTAILSEIWEKCRPYCLE